MKESSSDLHPVVEAIRASGMAIDAPIAIGDPKLWFTAPELEGVLDQAMRGLSFKGLPLRTRSKAVKQAICQALGYPVPSSFKKTQPRFLGQSFDVYTQKSNNLQIWNEELSASRRYVLVRLSDDDVVVRVKAVTGDTLALMDTTGTLTSKFQARCIPTSRPAELVSRQDTERLREMLPTATPSVLKGLPIDNPVSNQLLPISTVFQRLSAIVGMDFEDAGADQERNRGAGLHRLVCKALGYSDYRDDGRFPDVRNQLLEVKLQTSPTIDLGLVRPESDEPLDVPMLSGCQVRHCDVRYAVFYGGIKNGKVILTHLMLSTGEGFFSRFTQFQGKVLNAKLQIPLPSRFFDT